MVTDATLRDGDDLTRQRRALLPRYHTEIKRDGVALGQFKADLQAGPGEWAG
jgi:hypothetical protein